MTSTTTTHTLPDPPPGLMLRGFTVRRATFPDLDGALRWQRQFGGDLYAVAASEDPEMAVRYPQLDTSIDGYTDVKAESRLDLETMEWKGWT